MFTKNLNSNYFTCQKLKCNNILISTASPDNVVEVLNKIYRIEMIFCVNGIYKFVCCPFKYLEDFYSNPIKSSKLGIYFAKGKGDQCTFRVEQISCT